VKAGGDMKISEILIGQKFSRLSVVGFAGKDRRGNKLFFVRCECDPRREPHVTYGFGLISGRIRSCGCIRAEQLRNQYTTHGMTNSLEYKNWEGMIQRCTNPKATKYRLYGGRGIKVCDRWRTFENFYADMGSRPSKRHSIDRYPNKDGDYEPNNCRWATPKEQAANTSPFVRVDHWLTRKRKTTTPTVT
jgi:hypothetical protein